MLLKLIPTDTPVTVAPTGIPATESEVGNADNAAFALTFIAPDATYSAVPIAAGVAFSVVLPPGHTPDDIGDTVTADTAEWTFTWVYTEQPFDV